MTQSRGSSASDDSPWLVADVGGTNVRLGLLTGAASPHDVRCLSSANHLDLVDAIEAYLAQVGAGVRPVAACVAVAGPVSGDKFRLTNGSWEFSRENSRRRLGLERLELINDLAALALSVPRLSATGLRAIGANTSRAYGHTIAVVASGTGLGVAGLLKCEGRWIPLPGEGGHVSVPAINELECEVVMALRAEQGGATAECLLSGPGLGRLYRLLAQVQGIAAEPRDAAYICASRGDPLSREALEMFCGMLGSMAGDVALTMGARGGVWLGGGVLSRLADILETSSFRQRFEDKFRMSAYVRSIPTFLITAPTPALHGAAAWLEQRATRDFTTP